MKQEENDHVFAYLGVLLIGFVLGYFVAAWLSNMIGSGF